MPTRNRTAATRSDTGGTIYNRIPVLRVEREQSRQQLADALGVNYQTVGYLERGDYNPSLELAFRISEHFNLPVEAIFSRVPFSPLSEEVFGRHKPSSSTQQEHLPHTR